MAADLPVPFQLVGAFEQVISLENSVHSVFLAYLRHGSLKPSFFRQRTVIGKKIQLEATVIRGHFVCADAEPPVQQMVVGFLIEPVVDYRFPEGESLTQVMKRTQEFLKELMAKDRRNL